MTNEEKKSYIEEMKRVHSQMMSESKELIDGSDDGGGNALDDIAQFIESTLENSFGIEWFGYDWSI